METINPTLYQARYTTMADSTPEDVEHIVRGLNHYTDTRYLTDLYCGLLLQLKHSKDGFPIDRFEHSLQSGTLAYRDGRGIEYVVCALLHDVGELFDPYSHDHVIAELLKNYVSDKNRFILQHHTTFQGFYYWDKIGLNKNSREIFKSSPHYEDCIEFVAKYDDCAFDTSYRNMQLDEFRPLLLDFFSQRRKNASVFD